jgi:four helix bundle protein
LSYTFERHEWDSTVRSRRAAGLSQGTGFSAKAAAWDKKHALVDHLFRASESIVLNLAEAARKRGLPARLRILDYAIGSSLECAGCLDLARIKRLLTPS